MGFNFTDAQKKVLEAARERLQREKWYRGVCCDDFPTDAEILKDFEGCVTQVVMTTEWWDGPPFGLKGDEK